MALPAGSPALDAGDNALLPAGLTADQRGLPFARAGGAVDVGAFEAQATATAVRASTGPSTYGQAVTFTTPDTVDGPTSFSATITWGDGSTSAGVLSGGGAFTVSGSHTYADPVNKTVQVTISHVLGYTRTANTISSAVVTICGYEQQTPVTPDYETPFAFAGTILRAVVEVGDDAGQTPKQKPSDRPREASFSVEALARRLSRRDVGHTRLIARTFTFLLAGKRMLCTVLPGRKLRP